MDITPLPLQATGLTKRFRHAPTSVTALSQVDFSVRPGEFVAVMGASGSGKSTLLHLLAGLTAPDEGRVAVEGQEITRLTDAALTRFRRRRVGLVFQAFNLIPALTAEQNILLPALADGRSPDSEPELEPLLAMLGLTDRRTHHPAALSGGEQQRVAIARALIMNPAIVLADEPTGNLDSGSSQTLCGMLKQLNQEQGRAIVVVTHEPAVASWADRIVVLRDGRILTEVSTRELDGPLALAAQYHQWTAGNPAEAHHA